MKIRYIFYGLVLGAVFLSIFLRREKNGISAVKAIVISLLLTASGIAGAMMLGIIETGNFGAISFYGSVFFIPVIFALFARLLKIPYGRMMDICAPGCCTALAMMKIHCYIQGCCGGRVLWENSNGEKVVFPSQFVELATIILILVVLILLSKKAGFSGLLYPYYMILYGFTRFYLNLLRDIPTVNHLLPVGNWWSLLAIAVGMVWLRLKKKKSDATLDY